ncbi:MAG: inositol monophosphatase family protein [Desertimonas sp.]
MPVQGNPSNEDVLRVFHAVADDVAVALGAVTDWGESGVRRGQYLADLHADDVAVARLSALGVGVLSEESGRTGPAGPPYVVVDPLDGSTNASRGVPWFATALCLVDDTGPVVGLVANQASGDRWWAVRGEGAWGPGADGPRSLRASGCDVAADAIVGISGRPTGEYGWAQFRALGASALDLCLVASGTLDAFVDMSPSAHGPWDYLAGTLIAREAGATVVDAHGRELVVDDHLARRTPVAAATATLLEALLVTRRQSP